MIHYRTSTSRVRIMSTHFKIIFAIYVKNHYKKNRNIKIEYFICNKKYITMFYTQYNI